MSTWSGLVSDFSNALGQGLRDTLNARYGSGASSAPVTSPALTSPPVVGSVPQAVQPVSAPTNHLALYVGIGIAAAVVLAAVLMMRR